MTFNDFIQQAHHAGHLVVQPRMGLSDPQEMRAGLERVRDARACSVGTITIDSFTRIGDFESAARAVAEGRPLNGFPIATHSSETIAQMLDGLTGRDFQVQVRHGSAQPQHIIRAMANAGLSITEGGPVSYCLPYGRVPLRTSVAAWRESCDLLGELTEAPHIETFGGCLLGQLCPPSMLVAISVLEALFFAQRGIASVSVSYAQQVHEGQDVEAVLALRTLCSELLKVDWHVVIYTYMGVFPNTVAGALELLDLSVDLARITGCERLIVKTTSESSRIPTVSENVFSLERAALRASRPFERQFCTYESQVLAEARLLVDAVLDCHPDIGEGLLMAFEKGLLDVPYCLHPDNPGRAKSTIDEEGRLVWSNLGFLPLRAVTHLFHQTPLDSRALLHVLHQRQRMHDRDGLPWRSPESLRTMTS